MSGNNFRRTGKQFACSGMNSGGNGKVSATAGKSVSTAGITVARSGNNSAGNGNYFDWIGMNDGKVRMNTLASCLRKNMHTTDTIDSGYLNCFNENKTQSYAME
ncbi:hypothetical protein PbJCM13498_04870 [Prolixibacter bellariivorans]|uniref:Uncharacterized protein n=1 Tax=Prolixibacter bellariivorans TaxID=314319 RepID=A0A5M4AV21_9BACT|nr:hypothetical protein [Prolixibacter bellariivorans]GET31624.1 hypothetical protein PbJCM13498_04870 [Prolixibacter bellariivorans]